MTMKELRNNNKLGKVLRSDRNADDRTSKELKREERRWR
jgi:hypothetical protein